MFIRTKRLFLRPAWPEDAAAVEAAVGHRNIAKNLGRVPWPYTRADAEAFVAGRILSPGEVSFLIFARSAGAPTLVGSIGFGRWRSDHDVELGYWIAEGRHGNGYATEAGRAVLELAFDGLRLPRLVAGHFIDNPASGQVLRKLGFIETGEIAPCPCLARGCDVDSLDFELTREQWLAQRSGALHALAA